MFQCLYLGNITNSNCMKIKKFLRNFGLSEEFLKGTQHKRDIKFIMYRETESFALILGTFMHMWCFARFGTIRTI